jgi:RND superfamily putative drug exporter
MKKKWLRITGPIVVIVIWLVVASFGGPTFGKLSSVSNNDQAAFLPSSSQSTKVENLQSQFASSTTLPAIVVLESNTSIASSAFPQLVTLDQKMQTVQGVALPSKDTPEPVVGPIPSSDNKAIEYIVPVSDTKNVQTVVKDLRQIVNKTKPNGTTAYVTGPAGLSADLVSAFGGIDGILLIVAIIAVFVILLLVYRALLLPFIVLLTAMFPLTAAILVVYGFASAGLIKLNGQSQGILSILVIGAATDYSLLLIARYKEALHDTESKWQALWQAYKAAFAPIAASAATVILALLCLLFSDLNSNRSLGPIAAIGIVFAFLAATTLLPALLLAFGRTAFWPFKPKLLPASSHPRLIKNPTGLEGSKGIWLWIGRQIQKRPVMIWIGALLILAVAISGLLQLKASGVSQTDVILGSSNAVDGQKALARHFDAGSGSPVEVVASQRVANRITSAILSTNGISQATVGKVVVNGDVLITATLKDDPYSQTAENVVSTLRSNLSTIDSNVLVGGTTAIALDTNTTAQNDLFKIIPIVLGVIFIILMILLRSIAAPVLLILSVAISYTASLGVSAIVFNHIFNFPGADPSVPLFGFVFLVALGVDYNIFLMTRVREESLHIGTKAGILRALTVTGSVITSAGVVLAATFAALGIIPILFLAQIAFIVAFGVLLDTILVRSLLVPALSYTLGKRIWWPSQLWRNGKE